MIPYHPGMQIEIPVVPPSPIDGSSLAEHTQPLKVQLQPSSYYGAILRKNLGSEIFKPVPSQIFYFFGYLISALLCFYVLVWVQPSWLLKLPLSLALGLSLGMLGFIGHEVMHGSVLRNPTLKHMIATVCLAPYMGSPTFWKFWHNKLHHSNTQSLIKDPDAFPTFRIFKHSKFMKFMFPYTPGAGTLRSYTYFFFWFCFNMLIAQTYFRFRNNIYEGIDHKKVNIEFALQVVVYFAIMATAFHYGGTQAALWVWFIPFLVQNYSVMSYISTNHNLSPLTNVNDPLINSVTVTNHRIFEFISMNFGYHVEHHIFPTVSSRHARTLHNAIKKEWPEKFQVTTKWKAMTDLYKTPRIYRNSSTLFNPNNLDTKSVKNYSIKV
jgi:fatty acid desaturase